MSKKLFFFVIFACSSYAMACTGIRLTASDGSVVTGRTLEFGVVIDTYAAVVPRRSSFTAKTPLGPGLVYQAKYAVVGMSCFEEPSLMDGMNEKGLVAAAFYFSGFAGYTEITKENQAKALSPIEFPNWILTQFATIEEVKEGLSSVVIAPTVIAAWGDAPAPLHYIVYDKKGESIVIEPIEGRLVVHENKLGVITNSPTFDWHLTNLRNFINLTPFNAEAIELRGVKLSPLGQGSGMVGLPGDFTPPSRFVRAAIFSGTAVPSKTGEEAALQAFHILNQFDIPVGVAREKLKTGFASDYTMMTSVKDPQALRYYYKSYEDQTIKFVDLRQFDLEADGIKKAETKGKQPMVDVSSDLVKTQI